MLLFFIRNMEEVHSILKECKELMVQACGTVPASLQIASCGSESSVTDGGVVSGVTSGGENVDITLRPETADKSEMNSSKVRLLNRVLLFIHVIVVGDIILQKSCSFD